VRKQLKIWTRKHQNSRLSRKSKSFPAERMLHLIHPVVRLRMTLYAARPASRRRRTMDRVALNQKMAPTAVTSNVKAIKQQTQARPASVQLSMVLHDSIIGKF